MTLLPAARTGNFHVQEHTLMILRYRFVCEAIMRLLSSIAIVMISAWMGIQVNPAAAQTFEYRWSIIPKAKAEPSPEADGHIKPDPQTQSQIGAEPTRGSEDRSETRSFKRAFSGKASYYSYRTGKTASGSPFNRNLPTAAHRSLPFGTRVRVTDLATRQVRNSYHHRPRTEGSRPHARPFARRGAHLGDYGSWRGPRSR